MRRAKSIQMVVKGGEGDIESIGRRMDVAAPIKKKERGQRRTREI